MYSLHQTEGIVLAAWPRGEADRTLRLYTRAYGGITLVAKGVRLEKSKLRGNIDLFCRLNAGFVAGREVYRLTYAQAEQMFPRMRADWDRYRAAGYIANLMGRVVANGEQDQELWQLLVRAFSFLDGSDFKRENVRIFLCSFELKFLRCLGYLPREVPRAAYMLVSAPAFMPEEPLKPHDLEQLSVFLRDIRQYANLGNRN